MNEKIKAGNHCIALIITFLALFVTVSCYRRAEFTINDRRICFDEDWRFIRDSLAGAENPEYDDSSWRLLDLPHDWSIEDLPGQNGVDIIGPFDKNAVDRMASGYTVGGTGWYRKKFKTTEEYRNKRVFLEFDGVYMNADVWLNGNHLGFHPYGYTPFHFDITPYLNEPGKENVVAVRVRNEGLNSRWYSGSGIYRHVWIIPVDPVHIDIAGGIFVTTPEVNPNSAQVDVAVTLVNDGQNEKSITVQSELFDKKGKSAGKISSSDVTLTPGITKVIHKLNVKKPLLWSLDEPNLYRARVSVMSVDGEVIDECEAPFGIRIIKIDAVKGLTVNGKTVKMIGGCFHHDNGPLGAVAIDRAEERKIAILKKTGFNAIRTSHNPPSTELLNACDRIGMLVIDEIFDMWETPKREKDYHQYFKEWWQRDVESWVKRDRNHPSVVIWSIGNEIRETYDTTGLRIARNLTGEIRRLDPTRAVTEAFNDFGWRRGQGSRWHEIPEHMALLDVIGYNYMYQRYEEDHERYPERVMVGTETNPPLALENYEIMMKHPYVIGYFVWTAIDNIGEAGVGMPQLRDAVQEGPVQGGPGGAPGAAAQPGLQGSTRVMAAGGAPAGGPQAAQGAPVAPGVPQGMAGGGFFRRETWPVFTNYQGDLDLTLNRKVPSYYQYVVWGKSKVEMFVHRPIPEGKVEVTSRWGFPDEVKSWNWAGREGQKFQVHVYTRSQKVRLELNGKIVGEQEVDQTKSITATFEVPYEPGTLVARCFDNGRETASERLKTTGRPAAIRLTADRTVIRAGKNDLSYVTAEIVDSNGFVVPDADSIMVNFEVNGNGKVAGVGSGDPRDMSSFQQPRKKTYEGRCIAVIKPGKEPGKIRVQATAEGLKGASAVITVK